jgi:NAD(P)-dependent dehydrogenase (short-subunit alcohol dehydrogenase family)
MNGGATLAGKRALVTGGGSGVGAVIALALAEEGAAVTIAGRRRRQIEDVAARAPASITPVEADVTEEASVAAMFEAAGAPVHIVVANAGAAESAPFAKTDAALWARMLAVNLTGTFLTFREALRRMKGSDWGRLIAVASTAGLKGYPYVAPYCAAKHGVVGLTRALALETARMGVTVNALCPGFMETPLLVRSVANIMAKTGKSEEEARLVLAGTNPMGRFVRPDEVACAVLWLCGPGADAVTGQAISISGGETS